MPQEEGFFKFKIFEKSNLQKFNSSKLKPTYSVQKNTLNLSIIEII